MNLMWKMRDSILGEPISGLNPVQSCPESKNFNPNPNPKR